MSSSKVLPAGHTELGITVPTGDADALRQASQLCAGMADRLTQQADALKGAGRVAGWKGAGAAAYREAITTMAAAHRSCAGPWRTAALALAQFATAVEDGQRRASKALIDARRADEHRAHAAATRSRAAEDHAAETTREQTALAKRQLLDGAGGLAGLASSTAEHEAQAAGAARERAAQRMQAAANAEAEAERELKGLRRTAQDAQHDVDVAGHRAAEHLSDAANSCEAFGLGVPAGMGGSPTALPTPLPGPSPAAAPPVRIPGEAGARKRGDDADETGRPEPSTFAGDMRQWNGLDALGAGTSGLSGYRTWRSAHDTAAAQRALKRFDRLSYVAQQAGREYRAYFRAQQTKRLAELNELMGGSKAGRYAARAGRILGPVGIAAGAYANEKKHMSPVENAMRTAGSVAGGALGGTAGATAGIESGPGAIAAAAAVGTAGAKLGDAAGGLLYRRGSQAADVMGDLMGDDDDDDDREPPRAHPRHSHAHPEGAQ